MSETALYRHFDGGGNLLYVGISIHPTRRFKEHSAASWIGHVARTEIERFPTREDAATAEKNAIIAERPLHNVIYGDDNKAGEAVSVDGDGIRTHLGLSVADMAQLVGVTRQGWYKIERAGDCAPTTARLLAYIEKYGPELAKEMMEKEVAKEE